MQELTTADMWLWNVKRQSIVTLSERISSLTGNEVPATVIVRSA